MKATTRDYIKLHFIVFLWGFTAILGKFVTLPAMEMVLLRTLLAAFGMVVVMGIFGHSFRIERDDLIKVLLTGGVVAFHWLTFFGSARVANVSVSLIGLATGALWAAFIEPFANKVKVNPLEVLLGLIVIAGLAFILTFNIQYKLGLLLAILSGFGTAAFAVINSKLIKRVSAHAITLYEMVGASITITLMLPFYRSYFTPDHQLHFNATLLDWVCIATLGWVCVVYTFTESVNLMKRISVFFIQLTLNLEPLYGMVMAVIFFKEHHQMNLNFYIGSVIILSAVIIYPFIKKKMYKAASPVSPTNAEET